MDEFFELEKKCKKLQLKKIVKYSSIIFVIIFSLIASYFLFLPTQKTKIIKKPIIKETHIPKKINKPKPVIKPKPKPKPKPIKKEIPKKEVKIPTLNIEFDVNNVKDITINSNKKQIQKPKPKIQEIKQPIVEDEIITFEKAYTLAKSYYNNEDFQTSMKWCKIASKLDNSNEDIWRLYALNLEKVGKKQKAIKVLKAYLKYKDSLELKYLLQRLEE